METDHPISMDEIKKAITDLYGDVSKIPESSITFVCQVFESENIKQLIEKKKIYEEKSKEQLIHFENQYENVLTEDNLEEILERIQEKESERE